NRNCLITGGSSGIGRAIAIEFARLGANITVIGRDTERLVQTLDLCDEARGKYKESMLLYSTSSITQDSFWEMLSQQPDPNIDILVNCAGVQYDGLLFRQEVGSIKETLQTNLLVPTLAAKYLGRSMVRRAVNMKGTDQTHSVNCIINISSVLAVKGGRGAAAYAASKAGVIGLTRSLAGEFGPLGLRVNAILPGYIRTRMTENMSERASSDAKKKIPLGRFGEPHEIAEAAVFLAQNQYANGCILNLDGG
ncbi:NAD(P)-binding protein, partial [Saccharata proteae CBS 121410]